MTTAPNFLIVGAGLTGATIAHELHATGRSVLVVDRRSHVAGNIHDYVHTSGIRAHSYGPHYFRTSSDVVWNFMRTFADFYPYHARVLSRVHGRLEVWPVTGTYMRQVTGGRLPRRTPFDAANFEQAMLNRLPRQVYDDFVREYTEKQWGVPATALAADLAKRVQVRFDDDPRLTPDSKHQGIPVGGYTALVERLLMDIPVELGVDYQPGRGQLRGRTLTVFTGPIDEYFGFRLGRLRYRGQRRENRFFDTAWCQPVGQVNEPHHIAGPHIRTIEWKHLMPSEITESIRGTLLTTETPYTPSDPDCYEYPFPDQANRSLYLQYKLLAQEEPDVLICGRLGEYRYYDMDQAVARALLWARRILGGELERAQIA